MKLSIIVPIYNQTEEVRDIVERALLRCQTSTKVEHEFLLMENGSKYPIRPGILPEPITKNCRRDVNSIAGAWNQGVAFSTSSEEGDVLCFLNDDCFVEPGWDKPLIECALAGPHVACPWTNGEKSDGVGITGWCFVVSRETFWKVGPFDEMFGPFFWEDTDWFHRAVGLGVKLFSVPASRVTHIRRTSCNTVPYKDHLFLAGRFRFAWKHELEDPLEPPAHWRAPLPEWPVGSSITRHIEHMVKHGTFGSPGGF